MIIYNYMYHSVPGKRPWVLKHIGPHGCMLTRDIASIRLYRSCYIDPLKCATWALAQGTTVCRYFIGLKWCTGPFWELWENLSSLVLTTVDDSYAWGKSQAEPLFPSPTSCTEYQQYLDLEVFHPPIQRVYIKRKIPRDIPTPFVLNQECHQ